jgi:hypothetical protein
MSAARAATRRAERDPTSVVMAWCTGGMVTSGFMDSVLGAFIHDGEHDQQLRGHMTLLSGPRVAEARTQIIRNFLTPGAYDDASWLWMLDDDMTFDADTLARLFEVADRDDAPVVGGLCFAGERGLFIRPTLYRFVNGAGDIEPIYDYPRNAVVKVDATGAACLLIHRSVLERMAEAFGHTPKGRSPYPWFVEGMASSSGHSFGEDIAFCLRLHHLRIPLVVDTRIHVGHLKTTSLDEAAYDSLRTQMPELYRTDVEAAS